MMSSVGGLNRRLQQLEAQLQALSSSTTTTHIVQPPTTTPSTSGSATTAGDVLRMAAELGGQTQSLLAKMDYRDSVTGAPRYGPGTKERLLEIDGRVKALTLQAASENLRASEAQASELKALELARTIASVAQAAAITTEESRYTTAETQLATELAREDALIAERARELREARALESQERQRCVENFKVAVEAKVTSFNSVTQDAEHLTRQLRSLSLHSGSTFVLSRSALLAVLDHILARPDERKFRCLKPHAPALKAELTGFEGGMECLCALGFRLAIEWTSLVEYSVELSVSSADIDLLSDKVVSRASSLLLEMLEPDPSTVQGLDAWTRWFDRLKACRDIVAAAS